MPLTLTSSSFTQNAAIPREHTCEGEDTSPPLEWTDAPAGTRSFALIVDDPDAPDPAAPKRTWVHWVLYNLPASATRLSADADGSGLPEGTRVGRNDWNRAEWGGPCPPIGRHRYFHKLYALDTELPDLGEATKSEVEQALRGHVIEQAELVGTYEKQG